MPSVLEGLADRIRAGDRAALGQAVRRNVPIVAIAVGVLGLAILVFLVLDVLIQSKADEAVEKMRSERVSEVVLATAC